MPDSQTIALALLAGGEVSHAYSSYLPSYFTIRSLALDGDPDTVARKVANLRSGYVPATVFGLGLATVISVIAKSPLPLLVGGAAALTMVTFYEGALPPGMRLDPLQALLAGVQANGRVPCPV